MRVRRDTADLVHIPLNNNTLLYAEVHLRRSKLQLWSK